MSFYLTIHKLHFKFDAQFLIIGQVVFRLTAEVRASPVTQGSCPVPLYGTGSLVLGGSST